MYFFGRRWYPSWGCLGCIGQIFAFIVFLIFVARVYTDLIQPLARNQQHHQNTIVASYSSNNPTSASVTSSHNESSTSSSYSSASQAQSSSVSSVHKSSISTSETSEDSTTVFKPEDVSDATIESITTYGDYLTMYEMIINDYLSQYESALKGTILYDASTFGMMKTSMKQQFSIQKQQYGAMAKMKIVGKSELVQFLKDFRDELTELVTQYKNALH